VAGLVTSACILMSTMGAFLRGYHVTVIEDCCGDRTREKHQAIMDIYGGYSFAKVSIKQLKEYVDKLVTV